MSYIVSDQKPLCGGALPGAKVIVYLSALLSSPPFWSVSATG